MTFMIGVACGLIIAVIINLITCPGAWRKP
jgi:hypothetical protein